MRWFRSLLKYFNKLISDPPLEGVRGSTTRIGIYLEGRQTIVPQLMTITSNLHQLTTSHRVVQYKKREKRNQIKQVIFDEDGRRSPVFDPASYNFLTFAWTRDFLTGFHKRKVARTEAARAKAKEKEKAERLESRRQVRCHRIYKYTRW